VGGARDDHYHTFFPNKAHKQTVLKLRAMSSEASLSSGPRDGSQTANPGDVVATWELRLNDGPHKVTFEHGTTSGKRVILIDGREVQYVEHATGS
jgi:hypothetical protein